MTSTEAAERVLAEAGEPLHYTTITDRMLEAGYWSTSGATPEATINARLSTSIKEKGGDSPFQQVESGAYSLLNTYGLIATRDGVYAATREEVVQVKRYKSNVQRRHVDELRGALHHHDAIQGTLLTLSGFASGAKEAALLPGAPPVSLIDGDRLLDLLLEHEIGIQKKPAVMYEVDDEYFGGEEE
jgi:hypothetical protein